MSKPFTQQTGTVKKIEEVQILETQNPLLYGNCLSCSKLQDLYFLNFLRQTPLPPFVVGWGLILEQVFWMLRCILNQLQKIRIVTENHTTQLCCVVISFARSITSEKYSCVLVHSECVPNLLDNSFDKQINWYFTRRLFYTKQFPLFTICL